MDNTKNFSLKHIKYSIALSLLTVIFGYSFGNLYISIDYYKDLFILSGNDVNVIVGTLVLGMLAGTFFGAWITYGSGRKLPFIASSCFGMLSIIGSFLAPNFSIFLCTNLSIGITFGIFFLSSLMYISEISASEQRGFCSVFLMISLTLGAVLPLYFNIDRYEYSSFLVISLLVFLSILDLLYCIVKLPESPRWLAINGYSDASLSVLFKLRDDMAMAAKEQAMINDACRGEDFGVELLLGNKHFRKLLWLLVIMSICFQIAGFVAIPYNFINILSFIDASSYNGSFMFLITKSTIIVGALGSLLATFTIDKFGRRDILLFSSFLCVVLLGLLCIWLVLFDRTIINLAIVCVLLLLYIFISTLFLSVFIGVLITELMPIRAREFGLSVILMFNYLALLFSFAIYNSVIIYFDVLAFFVICLIAAIILYILVYLFMPNPTGVILEGLENRLFSGFKLKFVGKTYKR